MDPRRREGWWSLMLGAALVGGGAGCWWVGWSLLESAVGYGFRPGVAAGLLIGFGGFAFFPTGLVLLLIGVIALHCIPRRPTRAKPDAPP